jgi:hypothetical protein
MIGEQKGRPINGLPASITLFFDCPDERGDGKNQQCQFMQERRES